MLLDSHAMCRRQMGDVFPASVKRRIFNTNMATSKQFKYRKPADYASAPPFPDPPPDQHCLSRTIQHLQTAIHSIEAIQNLFTI